MLIGLVICLELQLLFTTSIFIGAYVNGIFIGAYVNGTSTLVLHTIKYNNFVFTQIPYMPFTSVSSISAS